MPRKKIYHIRSGDGDKLSFGCQYAAREESKKIYLKAKHQNDLIPQPCEICGDLKRVHGHHEDYSDPLNVIWLCPSHHMKAHGNVSRAEARENIKQQFIDAGEIIDAEMAQEADTAMIYEKGMDLNIGDKLQVMIRKTKQRRGLTILAFDEMFGNNTVLLSDDYHYCLKKKNSFNDYWQWRLTEVSDFAC